MKDYHIWFYIIGILIGAIYQLVQDMTNHNFLIAILFLVFINLFYYFLKRILLLEEENELG